VTDSLPGNSPQPPVALVTGGAQRIGAEICRRLHEAGYTLALHYRNSRDEAVQLAAAFNEQRPESCQIYGADLCEAIAVEQLCETVLADFGGLDLLVNNASLYYRTEAGSASPNDWNQLISGNLRAPFLLVRQLQEALTSRNGSIVNILDAHSHSAAPGYSVYDMTRSGLESLTRSLARELAPGVRVNGVAPGMILWPQTRDEPLGDAQQQALLDSIPMGQLGSPTDIGAAVLYLAQAPYVTGHVLVVDGGRSLV
jgi:pteridine reductase